MHNVSCFLQHRIIDSTLSSEDMNLGLSPSAVAIHTIPLQAHREA